MPHSFDMGGMQMLGPKRLQLHTAPHCPTLPHTHATVPRPICTSLPVQVSPSMRPSWRQQTSHLLWRLLTWHPSAWRRWLPQSCFRRLSCELALQSVPGRNQGEHGRSTATERLRCTRETGKRHIMYVPTVLLPTRHCRRRAKQALQQIELLTKAGHLSDARHQERAAEEFILQKAKDNGRAWQMFYRHQEQ